KRIIEMGFVKGKSVEVVLNAPLKDPVEYKILGYKVSLRRQEAELIEVVNEAEARSFGNPPILAGLPEDVAVSDDQMKAIALNKRRTINVALVGNPNCGKTSLFNIASGSHEHVGNYSGVTVDAKVGTFNFQGYDFRLIDLPGTYSLSAYSPEELYVRRYIVDQTPDIVINVVDASNLERNLYLTTQLLDMNVKMVIALNMFDELQASGNELDYHTLSKLIGVPMIPTVSRSNKGIEQLFHVIINIYEGADFLNKDGEINKEVLEQIQTWHDKEIGTSAHEEHMADFTHEHSYGDANLKHTFRHIHVNHGQYLEEHIDRIKLEIQKNPDIRDRYSTRFLAIKLLENDSDLEQVVRRLPNADRIFALRDQASKAIMEEFNESSESAITDAKYAYIQGAMKETFVDHHLENNGITARIDRFVTHRWLGFPIFMILLFLMFEGTFILGDYPMQGIEWLVDQLSQALHSSMNEGPLKDMIIDGIIGGVGGVIVFLPNILILYFFISIMEDSGYMARA
ncbi:MAG: 50S ribosome-binding GTPase, partial [Paludibacteraceae bacterium]|nr:50S ribosome-binding GTPase [Paludibacteraceae bacterium]